MIKLIKFELNTDVTNIILNELRNARKYVRMAIFQIHNKAIFDMLNQKLSEKVVVEIFTLPYDSINEDMYDEVTKRFQNLEKNGAKIYFCKWNVGDPERTTTATARWYLFHGKLIVTDQSAIALSANFTDDPEIDAILIYENVEKINEYNKKFDELVELFINNKVKNKILDTGIPDIDRVFELPKIANEQHRNHWIQHYPASICPENISTGNNLYLTPFDCRGRNFFESVISNASKFIYISAESFTDPDFPELLIKHSLRDIEIKILTGSTSMDFSERLQNTFRDLLAHKITVRTTDDIHAKMILTDKILVISSININKMNLGFSKTSQFWRENTESIDVCTESQILEIAKEKYLKIFNESIRIETKIAEKMERFVGRVFNQRFGLRTRREVKTLCARLIMQKEIDVKKFITDLCQLASKIMIKFNKHIVDSDIFLMALILHYLSERKHDFDQLNEKLILLDTGTNTNELLTSLSDKNFIEKEDDFYKIKLDTLLR